MFLFTVSTLLITLVSLGWLIKSLVGRDDWRVFGPMGVLMLCYFYYCGIGPWVLHFYTSMEFMGLDFHGSINKSALMALVSFIVVHAGYFFYAKKGDVSISAKVMSGVRGELVLYFLFFGMFVVSQAGSLSQIYNVVGARSEFDDAEAVDLMGFQMYLYLMFSSCIACVAIMWAKSEGRIIYKIIAMLLTVNLLMVILATGFRLRVVFLALSVISMMVLRFRDSAAWRHGRKWLIIQRLGLIGVLCGITVVGMSTARKYGQGLDMDNLKSASIQDLAVNSFNDVSIYYTGGIIADYVDSDSGYTYFDTYRAALLRVIPSAIYGEKPMPKTMEITGMAMGGGKDAFSAGFAFPFYVENYVSFGWIGLIVGSFLLGMLCAWVSNRLLRLKTGLAAVLYATCSGYAFVYFHRGYFPQQLEFGVFMVGLPLWALSRFSNKRNSRVNQLAAQ